MATISKRRDRWVLDFYDNQGKRRWKTLPEGTTKGKAKEILREIEDQLAKGNYIPENKVPLFGEVAQDWLEYKKQKIRQSTWLMYKGHLTHHFDSLNLLKIKMINTAKIEKFIAVKQEQDMNITTLRKILVTLNQVLSYAIRHNYIIQNPLSNAERPRRKDQGGNHKDDINVLNIEQINALMRSTKSLKYRTLFMLAILSGARQGELLGLKWSDVNWETNQIHIQRSFNTGKWYDPKTKDSNRKVDIGPRMMIALKEWKIACPPNELGLIFPNKTGNPISQSNMLRRHFYPALRKAQLPRIRFHDLRHTYASLLIEQGENIKYIQSQLGHSTPTVTLSVYAHLMKPINQEAVCKLEKTIFE